MCSQLLGTEDPIPLGMVISPNGYDLGRCNFVEDALRVKSYQGVNYKTTADNLTAMGLLPSGHKDIDGITTDGVVMLLTIKIVP